MRLLLISKILLLLLLSLTAFVHQDRIERPTLYRFTFKNGESIDISAKNPELKNYCTDIVNNKRSLIKAEMKFDTGESMVIEKINDKWSNLKIFDKSNNFSVPEFITNKISEIHFQSIELLWNGTYKKPFISDYFYVQLEIGREKSFDEYPVLQLKYNNKKFMGAELWRKINEHSKQPIDFK